MMNDIDNEFDEIDSLLRDVDSLKVQEMPTTGENKSPEESMEPATDEWLEDLKRRRRKPMPSD